jgi:hypothetical protein
MKKKFINIRSPLLRALAGSFALLSLLVLVMPQNAQASLAANTQITNGATLTYNDGAAVRTATASVTVKVSLVPAAPTIVAGPNQSTQYAGPATTLTDTFTITSGSNGPDTYNLTTAVTGDVNGTGASSVVNAPTSITLGASVTIAGSSTTIINVPSDGVSDAKVNGIAVGDTIVIGSDVRTVTAISDPATGTATITVGTAFSSAPAAGVPVQGQKIVSTTVTSGTITVVGISLVVSDTLTATSATAPNPAATSSAVTNTYTSGLATLNKYVRNVTTPNNAAGSTPYAFNGNTYYWKDNSAGANAVAAKPGEVLEYILVAANTGTGAVTASVITDIVPASYVTFKLGAYGGAGKDVTYWPDSTVPATSSIFTAAAGDDAAVYTVATLTVNVGGATPPTPPAAGGTIAAGKAVVVIYQVTVNP